MCSVQRAGRVGRVGQVRLKGRVERAGRVGREGRVGRPGHLGNVGRVGLVGRVKMFNIRFPGLALVCSVQLSLCLLRSGSLFVCLPLCLFTVYPSLFCKR